VVVAVEAVAVPLLPALSQDIAPIANKPPHTIRDNFFICNLLKY
jgi:hypothetical protein